MEEESKSGRKVEYTKDTGKMDLKIKIILIQNVILTQSHLKLK